MFFIDGTSIEGCQPPLAIRQIVLHGILDLKCAAVLAVDSATTVSVTTIPRYPPRLYCTSYKQAKFHED